MMKGALFTILLIAAALTSSCTKTADNSVATASKPTPVAASTPNIPKDGNYRAKGVVTNLNPKDGSVELDHEDIPDLMPKMKMEFHVRDASILDGIKIGDKVDFLIEYKHPTEVITSIQKTP